MEVAMNKEVELIYKNCIGKLNTTCHQYKWKYIQCDRLKPDIMSLTIKENEN